MKTSSRSSREQERESEVGGGGGGETQRGGIARIYSGKRITSLSVTSLSSIKKSGSRHHHNNIGKISSGSTYSLTRSQNSASSSSSSGVMIPGIASSKSTLCLYHVTFLTFMIVTLLFFIITIGASESDLSTDTEDSNINNTIKQQQNSSYLNKTIYSNNITRFQNFSASSINLDLKDVVNNNNNINDVDSFDDHDESSTIREIYKKRKDLTNHLLNKDVFHNNNNNTVKNQNNNNNKNKVNSVNETRTTSHNFTLDDSSLLKAQIVHSQSRDQSPNFDTENNELLSSSASSFISTSQEKPPSSTTVFISTTTATKVKRKNTSNINNNNNGKSNNARLPSSSNLNTTSKVDMKHSNHYHNQSIYNSESKSKKKSKSKEVSSSQEPPPSSPDSAFPNYIFDFEKFKLLSAQPHQNPHINKNDTISEQADLKNEIQSDQPATSSENWANRLLRTFGFGRFLDPPQNQTWGKQGTKQRGSRSVCRLSEFNCKRGKCIPSDKFCDGVNDCGDEGPGSDEPFGCSPCNRTYYGEWGSTYSLSLSSETISNILQGQHGGSGKNSLPGSSGSGKRTHFVCQLAFAAAGDNFGDLVQIMFDSINIGQFASSSDNGCPTGSLQIFEINRPITGGHWCGSGSGYSVYFSEMSAIVLTLTLGNGQQQWPGTGGSSNSISSGSSSSNSSSGSGSNSGGGGSGGSRAGGHGHGATNDTVHNFSKWTSKGGDTTVITSSQQPNPLEFDFKIRYKFIPRSLAVVRYGLVNSPIERGVLVPDTYCSRVLDTCHKTRCKIQSPNYPGLYPRNVTCFYTVRQREIPPCKRVLIQVNQIKPHKVQLRSIPGRQISGNFALTESTNVDAFLAWEDCRGDRDTLIIYDGTTTNDPVLLKLCGGSYIPPITSSGPAILVAFHSTAFGNPLDPKPAAPFPSPLRGFELDVGVVIVDSESADYTNHQHNCSFVFISSRDGEGPDFKAQHLGGNWVTAKSGVVSSPRHTVPQNTMCRYEFRGGKHEAIWIYFVAYRRGLIKDSKEYTGNCTTRIRILDGIDSRNNALLGSYCDNELPRLCDHKALQNETRIVRACTANESYISAGNRLIVEQQFMEGTALRPLHYQFNYEFVRRHVGTDGSCNRHYNLAKMKSHRGVIRTSDNVFDFGRGGRTNLTCIYTFTLPSYESLHIKILNSSFGERPCKTLTDFETGRYVCNETMENSQNSNYYNNMDASGSSSNNNNNANSGRFLNRASASLQVYEEIWTNLNVSSHENCICGNSSNNPSYFFTFLGRKVHLKFTIENMKSTDSPENFFVFLEYEVKSGGCRGDNHYMKTESGMISLESSFSHGPKEKPPTCEHYPWIIEAKEGHSLYLRVPGFAMMDGGRKLNGTSGSGSGMSASGGMSGSYTNHLNVTPSNAMDYLSISTFENRLCPTTKNRIFIYDRNNKRIQKICPASNILQMTKKTGQVVEIYSEDFDQYNSPLYPPAPPKFIIEFIGRELGSYRISWLEVMSAKMKLAMINMEKGLDKTAHPSFKAATNLSLIPGIIGPPKLDEDGLIISDNLAQINEKEPICPSFCPEINACISEKLWCDGTVHCPISLSDEKSCDSFWLRVGQLMSPAVYIPVAAAIVSALVCCGLVMLCVFIKRTVLNGRVAKEDGNGVSSLDRRLPRFDPHDPLS